MQYGLPYMGSKNSIASNIVDILPKATNFYDLFAGGCAITHAAILASKYKHIYFNDINGSITKLFYDAIKGKYSNENRWISREDFFKLKDIDAYVKYIWSFGNQGNAYLYGADIEEFKKAYWYAVMFNNYSIFLKLGIKLEPVNKDWSIHKKKIAIKKQLLNCGFTNDEARCASLERLERLKSLESLERLERLKSLESLERLERSYDEVHIYPDSVIYCDIPYEQTAKYDKQDFDHKKFYTWAVKQTELTVISSYNISDDRFMAVEYFDKRSLLAQNGAGKLMQEKLFIPKHQYELWKSKQPAFTKLSGKQLSIWDLGV